MNVNSSGSMQQMQMRQMDGTGKGQGGMKDIMQSLSQEDRTALKEKMNSMPQEDRRSMVSQMKEVDATSMSSDEYAKTLLDIIDQSSSSDSFSSNEFSFSIYA